MKSIYVKLILFSILIILIGSIRFNRSDFAVSDYIVPENKNDISSWSDAVRYIALTDYYKGKGVSPALIPPYTTRVLVPLAASVLPFESGTSINLINLALTIAGLFVLYRKMLFYELSNKLITLGLFLYSISFPVFYYTTIGYVDASFIFFLYLALLFILKERFFLLIIVFILGCMVKETMIIVIPLYFISEYFKNKAISQIIIRTFLFATIFVSVILILRYLRPDNLNFWAVPSIDRFLINIQRSRTYLSFILTFGISGFGSILLIFLSLKKMKEIYLHYNILIAGSLLGILVWIYSLFTAYSDGRFIWVSLPFTTLLLLNLMKGSKRNSAS